MAASIALAHAAPSSRDGAAAVFMTPSLLHLCWSEPFPPPPNELLNNRFDKLKPHCPYKETFLQRMEDQLPMWCCSRCPTILGNIN